MLTAFHWLYTCTLHNDNKVESNLNLHVTKYHQNVFKDDKDEKWLLLAPGLGLDIRALGLNIRALGLGLALNPWLTLI